MNLPVGNIMMQVLFVIITSPVILGIVRGMNREFVEIKFSFYWKSVPYKYFFWGVRRILMTAITLALLVYLVFTVVLLAATQVPEWEAKPFLVFYYIALIFFSLFLLLSVIMIGKTEESKFFQKPENKGIRLSLKKFLSKERE